MSIGYDRPILRRIPLWLLTLAVVACSGCALSATQKAAVSQFSTSASVLGDRTTEELTAMREDTIKMTTERLLLAGPSTNPSLGDQATLDRGFELTTVETVTGATRALAAYGKSLTALVEDTQSAKLQEASNEFVASLGRVPSVKDKVSDDQLQAIGTVVQEVGGLWIEWKRKRAVRTIVNNSSSAVDHLCDLLIRDFGSGGWVALQLQVVEDPLMGVATSALAEGKTYEARQTALDAFRLAHSSRMRRTEVLKRVTDAADAMKKANEALVQAVATSQFSFADIEAFATKARSLAIAVRTIGTE